MLKGILNSIPGVVGDFKDRIAKIDFQNLGSQAEERLSNGLKSLEPEVKKEIRNWFEAVANIKNDNSLSLNEKESKIKSLPTSDLILRAMMGLLSVVVNEMPIENKDLAKAGISGAGVAISLLSFEFSGMALFLFSKALPSLIMTKGFDNFQSYLLDRLVQEDLKAS